MLLTQKAANVIVTEHLTVRGRARHSPLTSALLTGLTSLSWRHTWGTWTPPRCSWTCTRCSPSNHRLRALPAFLAFTRKQNKKHRVNATSNERKGRHFQLKIVFPRRIVVIKQQTAAMSSTALALHPLTDVSLNKALIGTSATVLPCGTLLVSHLRSIKSMRLKNDRCYGWKHAFIRRSAVVERNSGRATLGHVTRRHPISVKVITTETTKCDRFYQL